MCDFSPFIWKLGSSAQPFNKSSCVCQFHKIGLDLVQISHNHSTAFQILRIVSLQDVNDEETRKWEAERTLKSLLYSFQDFAQKINGACDADQNSFDGMVLLTGRGETLDDVEPRMKPLNSICKQV